jgi:hypothetical protein
MSLFEDIPDETPQERRRRKRREYKATYRAANPDKIKEQNRNYRTRNRAAILEQKCNYRAANRDKINDKINQYRRVTRKTQGECKWAQEAVSRPGVPIPGYAEDRIRVGEDGSVWKRGSQSPVWRKSDAKVHSKRGIAYVTAYRVSNEGLRREKVSVAKLVCLAFHGPKPLGCEPFHYPDPMKSNCRASNLSWAPRKRCKPGGGTSTHRITPPAMATKERRNRLARDRYRQQREADIEKARAKERARYQRRRVKQKEQLTPSQKERLREHDRRKRARKRPHDRWLESIHGGPPGQPVPPFPAHQVRVTREGEVWTRVGHRVVWVRRKLRFSAKTPVVELRRSSDGYGYKSVSVATLVCQAFHGPRPLGCVPFHYPDPSPMNCQADNLRWAPRGTQLLGKFRGTPPKPKCGEDHPQAKLTDSAVIEIRQLSAQGMNYTQLASHYGVSATTIKSIVQRKTWGHVP